MSEANKHVKERSSEIYLFQYLHRPDLHHSLHRHQMIENLKNK